jgi:tripartite ATP-independent transporter DctM subunit
MGLIIFGLLMIVLLSGVNVGFGFMLISLVGTIIIYGGGERSIFILFTGMRAALSNFFIISVPMFILLGEVMFHSGLASNMLDAVDAWLGKLPGRLGLVAVSWSTLLAASTGVNMASAAMLGKLLLPEMEKRGYNRTLSLGCIMGPGGLAMIIPPSGLAVLLGVLAEIPIGKLLITGVPAGLLMATLMGIYIIGISWLKPSMAPRYDVKSMPLSQKLKASLNLIPLAVIICCVMGLMFFGIATPTEAAAAGAAGSIVLAALRGRLNWPMFKRCIMGTVEVSCMIFLIIAGATVFTQIIAYTGITSNLSKFAVSLPLPPIGIMICMQIVVLFLGCLIDPVSIMMITIPIFMPIVRSLHFDPLWFGIMYLINIDVGFLTPPFGMTLFVMKGVSPPGTTIDEIYRAAVPFIIIDIVAIVFFMVFPHIALFLPNMMMK